MRYSLNANKLTDETTGEEYPIAFLVDGRRWWGVADLEGGGLGVTDTGAVVEVVKEGAGWVGKVLSDAKVKAAKKGGAPTHLVISPATEDIQEGPAEPVTITFEGRRYALDAAAVDLTVAQLPDGRYLSLWMGKTGMRPAALLIDPPAKCGRATALDLAPTAPMGGALAFDAPPPASLLAGGPEALDESKAGGVRINVPIYFWQPATLDTRTGQTRLNPCRGVVLGMFPVPENFGAPGNRGEPKARRAFWVLTTAEGVIVSDRDEKHFAVPAFSVIWVDMKHDLKGMGRYLPAFQGEQVTRAFEVLINPLFKKPFQTNQGGKIETWSAWRMNLNLVGVKKSAEELAFIAAKAGQVPVLPWETAGDGIEYENPGDVIEQPAAEVTA